MLFHISRVGSKKPNFRPSARRVISASRPPSYRVLFSKTAYCYAVDLTKAVLDNFNHECLISHRSGRHYEKSVHSDLNKVVMELSNQQAFSWTPGRRYRYFSNFDSSLLDSFDLQDRFRWINGHKKNIVRSHTAR